MPATAEAFGGTSHSGVKNRPNQREIADTVNKHQAFLERKRHPWEQLWSEVAELTNPIRENIWDSRVSNSQRDKRVGQSIFDGHPVFSLNLFADGLHGYMVSPSIQWFRLRLPRFLRNLEKIPEVRGWLQDVESHLYNAFQNSNFYTEARQFFKDGGSIGTAVMTVEEDIGNKKIVFTTRHIREMYISHNKYRKIDLAHRKYKIEARVAVDEFGLKNLSIPARNMAINSPFSEIEILHAVAPRVDHNPDKLGVLNKKFSSVYMESNSKNILRESGFDMFPHKVWRYATTSNDIYAYSPVIFAFADIKGLNIMGKTLLQMAEQSVDPAYNVPTEMAGAVRLIPHGMNYYEDAGRVISAITTGANFPITMEIIKEKRALIDKHLNVDFFLMLAQSERQKTATEITELMGEKASVMSAAIGDLTTVLDDQIDNVYDIELKANRLPPVPQVLAQFGGQSIDIVYMGSLAQAQRRLFQGSGIRRGLEVIVNLADSFPEAKDVVNIIEGVKELLITEGVPEEMINSDTVIESIQRQRAEANAKAQNVEGKKIMAEIVKDLSQATKNAGPDIVQEIAQNVQS